MQMGVWLKPDRLGKYHGELWKIIWQHMQWPKRNRNNLERHNLKLLTKCVNIYFKKTLNLLKNQVKVGSSLKTC